MLRDNVLDLDEGIMLVEYGLSLLSAKEILKYYNEPFRLDEGNIITGDCPHSEDLKSENIMHL